MYRFEKKILNFCFGHPTLKKTCHIHGLQLDLDNLKSLHYLLNLLKHHRFEYLVVLNA